MQKIRLLQRRGPTSLCEHRSRQALLADVRIRILRGCLGSSSGGAQGPNDRNDFLCRSLVPRYRRDLEGVIAFGEPSDLERKRISRTGSNNAKARSWDDLRRATRHDTDARGAHLTRTRDGRAPAIIHHFDATARQCTTPRARRRPHRRARTPAARSSTTRNQNLNRPPAPRSPRSAPRDAAPARRSVAPFGLDARGVVCGSR